jgi:hypothetical protein
MWQGFRHGLHYLDHIKLLSPKIDNVVGGVYSVYQFKNDGHWSVSFELKITGEMGNAGNGVLLNIGGSSLIDFSSTLIDSEYQITDSEFSTGINNVVLLVQGSRPLPVPKRS